MLREKKKFVLILKNNAICLFSQYFFYQLVDKIPKIFHVLVFSEKVLNINIKSLKTKLIKKNEWKV